MKNFFVLSVILVATLVFGETMAASAQGYLGLPPIARDEFNRITRYYYYDAVCWMKDERHAQVIDSDEVATCDGAIDHLDRFVAKKKFTALFDARYRRIIELRRQELLQAELGKLGIQTIRTQLSDSKLHLSAPEQKMLMHLVRAGNLIEQAHHLQLNTWELNASAINRGTPTDAAFVRHFQTPWCEGIEDPLCNAMSTFPSERRFYPQSFFDDKGNARCDLLTKGGRELLNPFYAIVKGDKGFVAQPFTVAYRGALEPAAAELRQAAELAKALPNEKPLATYLDKAAEALLRDGLNPFHESDQAWLDAAHESKFYVRIGADEQYWEDCHVKAGYHAQIGIVDPVASQTLEAYRPHIKAMEGLFEKRIGTATYKARDVQVKMPEVVDVILFSGDARSANQTTIGQTLPNQCGPDGTEQCTSNRTIVYRNHIEASYTGKSAPRIYLMFAEEVRKNFNAQGSVDLTALHEFAHNLGP
ncbi:MAG: hypothetical protein HY540_01445, partial [Deltaproteobacteria bacterium]|nr:hypothetical protein [Deltaproteobacteria bacterium]